MTWLFTRNDSSDEKSSESAPKSDGNGAWNGGHENGTAPEAGREAVQNQSEHAKAANPEPDAGSRSPMSYGLSVLAELKVQTRSRSWRVRC